MTREARREHSRALWRSLRDMRVGTPAVGPEGMCPRLQSDASHLDDSSAGRHVTQNSVFSCLTATKQDTRPGGHWALWHDSMHSLTGWSALFRRNVSLELRLLRQPDQHRDVVHCQRPRYIATGHCCKAAREPPEDTAPPSAVESHLRRRALFTTVSAGLRGMAAG